MYLLFLFLGYFLPFYCPNSPRNQNKKEQKTHTHTKTKKHLKLSTVPKIWCATDTRTEKVAYRGGSPIQKNQLWDEEKRIVNQVLLPKL